jgi:hypothetical protein
VPIGDSRRWTGQRVQIRKRWSSIRPCSRTRRSRWAGLSWRFSISAKTSPDNPKTIVFGKVLREVDISAMSVTELSSIFEGALGYSENRFAKAAPGPHSIITGCGARLRSRYSRAAEQIYRDQKGACQTSGSERAADSIILPKQRVAASTPRLPLFADPIGSRCSPEFFSGDWCRSGTPHFRGEGDSEFHFTVQNLVLARQPPSVSPLR